MSEQPAAVAPVRLHVKAPNPAADLAIFDHSLKLVRSGVGELDVALPPGLYDVETSIGNSRERKFLSLVQPLTVAADEWDLTFPSSVPLSQLTKPQDAAEGVAERLSRAPTGATTVEPGPCRLFVFLQRVDRPISSVEDLPSQPFWSELRLSTADGRLVSAFDNDVAKDPQAGWCALTLDLRAGGYILSGPGPADDDLCLPLWVLGNFETHVFVSVDQGLPILDKSSISMAPKGKGFDLTKKTDAAYAATLLSGFQRGRDLVDSKPVRRMLEDKFYDPFAGIIAAHALLRAKSTDRQLVEEVIGNLRQLLGDHPDLIALELIAGMTDERVVKFPPTLRIGLDGVLSRSASEPEIVELNDLFSDVLGTLLPAQYTLWRRPKTATRQLLPAIMTWVASLSKAVPTFSEFLRRGGIKIVPFDFGAAIASFEDWFRQQDPEKLATELGLPRSLVKEVMGRIPDLLAAAKRQAEGRLKDLQIPVPIGVSDALGAAFIGLLGKVLSSVKPSPLEKRVIQLIVQAWRDSTDATGIAAEAARCQRRLAVLASNAGKAGDLIAEPAARDDARILAAMLAGLAARLYPFLLVGRGPEIRFQAGRFADALGESSSFIGLVDHTPLGAPFGRSVSELLVGGLWRGPQAEEFVPISVESDVRFRFLKIQENYWAAGIDLSGSSLSASVAPAARTLANEWVDERFVALATQIDEDVTRLLHLVRAAINPIGSTAEAESQLPEAVSSLRRAVEERIRMDRGLPQSGVASL